MVVCKTRSVKHASQTFYRPFYDYGTEPPICLPKRASPSVISIPGTEVTTGAKARRRGLPLPSLLLEPALNCR
jgi:hypothetical protein